MSEEIALKEAVSQDGSIQDGEAVIPLEEQKRDKETLFNTSTVTIVLQLLPLDGGDLTATQLGLLSIRNDNDAPLFGALLRGAELVEFLEISTLARLIENLKDLMPGRQKEREMRTKEKTAQAATPPPSGSNITTAKRGKPNQKPGRAQAQLPAKSTNSIPELAGQPGANTNPSVPQSIFTPQPATEEVTGPVEGATTPRQLTLF